MHLSVNFKVSHGETLHKEVILTSKCTKIHVQQGSIKHVLKGVKPPDPLTTGGRERGCEGEGWKEKEGKRGELEGRGNS